MRQKSYLVAFLLITKTSSGLASDRAAGDTWRVRALQVVSATAGAILSLGSSVAGQSTSGVPQGLCQSTDQFGDGCTTRELDSGQCATYGDGTFVPEARRMAMYFPNGTQMNLVAGQVYHQLGTVVQWCWNSQGDMTLQVGSGDSNSKPAWAVPVVLAGTGVLGLMVGVVAHRMVLPRRGSGEADPGNGPMVFGGREDGSGREDGALANRIYAAGSNIYAHIPGDMPMLDRDGDGNDVIESDV